MNIEVLDESDQSVTIFVKNPAVFSTWIQLRKHLLRFYQEEKKVILDLTESQIVDFTVKSKLIEWEKEFKNKGLELSVKGLI